MSSCTYESLHPVKPFVFKTTDVQNAANTVYLNLSTINAAQIANGVIPTKQFKTDRERMQYLQGQRARDTTCSG
uniref:Uncharacterized protein n=1 Tax=viral metagenome TaxID=1070528 RepID=A0A6C0K5Z7_9ZZZZ